MIDAVNDEGSNSGQKGGKCEDFGMEFWAMRQR